ncbi:MAG: hypothetical protein M1825_005164 [Sarcosagium campestre]|nr:MAG: hypothetical protein M1825_005164 [Sarcosagium campestre]
MAKSSLLTKVTWTIALAPVLYFAVLALLSQPWPQRHALYVHKLNTAWLWDLNNPVQFGFAQNQITPFNIQTPDNETLYAWHVLPLGLYAKNEVALIEEPSGLRDDILQSKAFSLLADDPDSRLVINFHGNAGTVGQGWRTDTYRSLTSGSSDDIHVLAVDYRGYGYSTGVPTEAGIIKDAVATIDWALNVARVPPERIVIVGQSLGTAVATAAAEHYISRNTPIEFAGVVLVAGFSDIPTLLSTYSILGLLPVLRPLAPLPALQRWITGHIIDTWNTSSRIDTLVRRSQSLHLSILHARNDPDIPWTNSNLLFYAAANATSEEGLTLSQVNKAKTTLDHGQAGWVHTWNAGGSKIIRQQVLRHGGQYYLS